MGLRSIGRQSSRLLRIGTHALDVGDACVIPQGADYALDARLPADVLAVALPQRDRSMQRERPTIPAVLA